MREERGERKTPWRCGNDHILGMVIVSGRGVNRRRFDDADWMFYMIATKAPSFYDDSFTHLFSLIISFSISAK